MTAAASRTLRAGAAGRLRRSLTLPRSNKETQFKPGSDGACPRAAMSRRIVKRSVLPGTPEHAHPGSGEDTDGMRVVAAAASGALVDVGGPGRAMPRVVGKAGDGGAQTVIAGPAEDDASAFAGLVGDGADAGLSGELVLGLEALAYVTEFGQDLGGADATGAREGGYDFAIGQFADGVFDARGQLGDLSDQRSEDGGPGAHEFALGIGFAVAGQTRRCAPQAR